MLKAIGTIQRRKKHAHASCPSGGWVVMSEKTITVKIHSGLSVERIHEYRYFFPLNGPACCTERRVCLYVNGPIKNSRDLRAVERALKQLA